MKHSLVDWRIYLYSIRASNVMKQDCWSSLTIAVVSFTECLLCCEPPAQRLTSQLLNQSGLERTGPCLTTGHQHAVSSHLGPPTDIIPAIQSNSRLDRWLTACSVKGKTDWCSGKQAYFFSYSNSSRVALRLTVFELMHAHWGERGTGDGNDMMVVELQIIFCGCHGYVRGLSGCWHRLSAPTVDGHWARHKATDGWHVSDDWSCYNRIIDTSYLEGFLSFLFYFFKECWCSVHF